MTYDQAIQRLIAGEVLVQIGCLDQKTIKRLDQMVARGDVAKWRGRWFPVAGARDGIGPLKQCYALPPVATWAQSDDANKASYQEWQKIAATDSLHRTMRAAGIPVHIQQWNFD